MSHPGTWDSDVMMPRDIVTLPVSSPQMVVGLTCGNMWWGTCGSMLPVLFPVEAGRWNGPHKATSILSSRENLDLVKLGAVMCHSLSVAPEACAAQAPSK